MLLKKVYFSYIVLPPPSQCVGTSGLDGRPSSSSGSPRCPKAHFAYKNFLVVVLNLLQRRHVGAVQRAANKNELLDLCRLLLAQVVLDKQNHTVHVLELDKAQWDQSVALVVLLAQLNRLRLLHTIRLVKA